jgi:hypothetical protein
MANYVDASTQTKWAGLMQRESVRPDILLSPPRDTTTPPDDMLTDKLQFVYGVPACPEPGPVYSNAAPPLSLVYRRMNKAGLVPRIEMPPAEDLDDEVLSSPPPTHALLSPLPEANKRHAGHTPLIAHSPASEKERVLAKEVATGEQAADGAASPDLDRALIGALTLPSNPVDGTEDTIELSALDSVLSHIAKQQAALRSDFDEENKAKSPPEKGSSGSTDDGLPLSRKVSAGSRRSAAEEYDGVLLKSPPSNFGAPLGSL